LKTGWLACELGMKSLGVQGFSLCVLSILANWQELLCHVGGVYFTGDNTLVFWGLAGDGRV
jgi:hypothetical protein